MISAFYGVVLWAVAAGEPAWVTRGSGAFPADKRSFYGVGIAQNIKNPALLRGAADNRARAEVGKVFEVYSAQLMKDYLSTDGQNIEQATKTFSAGSQQGAEIVDRYLSGDGTQYSLCVLNLDRAKELIEAAQASGAIKSVVKMNADQAYDELVGILKNKGKSNPPAPKAAEVTKPPAPTNGGKAEAPPADVREQATNTNDGEVKVRKGGGRPAWIDGEDPAYAWNKYLYAVGFGKDRTASENGALAGLSKIFEVRISQVAKDFVASYSRSDKPKGLEVQSSSQLTEALTSKSLNGVRIVEVWSDGASTTYALALLDRAVAAAKLRDQISELDQSAKLALDKAADPDRIKQLRALNQALSAIQEREALNSDLRVVNVSGIGMAPELSYADVYEKLEGAQEALNVGILVEGPMGNDLRAALAAGLTELGYAVSEVDDEDDDQSKFDLLIIGEVRHEKAGKIQNGAFEVVRAVADFKLKNVKKNKVIDEYTVSAKEGHKTVQEASRRATRELQKIIAPEIGKRFQKYLTKK